jgi:thiol:disulfide interchange protein DsbD
VTVELAVPRDMKADKHEIAGVLGFMTCSETGCDKPEGLSFAAAIPSGMAGPATVRFEQARYIDAVKAAGSEPVAATAKPPAVGFDAKSVVVRDSNETASMPIWMAMLFGLAGGFILNFMPCVLPVIGLKILSFVEQSGHSRGRIFILNAWYTLGMLSVFMLLAVLAVFFEFGWGQLFTFSAFNIVLVGVVFTMALSFLGVWEIPLPGFVGTGRANDLAAQGGLGGAFFKGVITTILATPCSGPFLGSALVWSVAQPPALVFALFGCIGLGMASPYLVIGAVPSLIRLLPRPGAWMDTFKQIMGFVLLATVVYILTLVPPPLVVPTVALLFGMWGACWWIGRTALTADMPAKLRAWAGGLALAALVGVFAFVPLARLSGGWFSIGGLEEIMAGRFHRDVEGAVAKVLAEGKRAGDEVARQRSQETNPNALPWEPFTEVRLVELTKAGKTVLVDFTADWCQTCKVLEYAVLNTPGTLQAVEAGGVHTLVADWTTMSDDVSHMLEVLGSKQIPVLAIFPAGRPNEPIVLRGGYSQATLLKAIAEAGPSQAAAAKNARRVTTER